MGRESFGPDGRVGKEKSVRHTDPRARQEVVNAVSAGRRENAALFFGAMAAGRFWLVVSAIGMVVAPLRADLIERSFGETGSDREATGTVLEGSKNMRHLGKRSKYRAGVSVVGPITAVPGFVPPRKPESPIESETERPRFGYGAPEPSDGRTPREDETSAPATAPEIGPVYEFHYSYPFRREYYYSVPYYFPSFGFGCHEFGAFRYGPRISLRFGW